MTSFNFQWLDSKDSPFAVGPSACLPISYLIDRDGLVVGYIVGAVEWDSPEAVDLLNYYIQ